MRKLFAFLLALLMGPGECLRGGILSGSAIISTSANLTTEGSLDWVYYKNDYFATKNTSTHYINGYSAIGSGQQYMLDSTRGLSWSDGNPQYVGSASNQVGGLKIPGIGDGFSFSAQASTQARKVVVHVGGWNSTCTLVAHLSDSSAADYTFTSSAANTGVWGQDFTFLYLTNSASQTIQFTWTVASTINSSKGTGEANLSAVAMSFPTRIPLLPFFPIMY